MAPNETIQEFNDLDFGQCLIQYKNDAAVLKDVCLFASHTILPFLPEYIYYYLQTIKAAGFTVVFISTSAISKNDIKRLSQVAAIVIEKENRGTDFGGWCSILRWLNYGKDFDNLYLCNDSVFGLFVPFEKIHKTFHARAEDIIGITDSHQGVGYHIQSYFIGIKQNVLQSVAWEAFWRDMTFLEDKTKVIEYYEIGLTQILMKAGFQWFVWADWSKKIEYRQLVEKVSRSETLHERWLNRLLQERENMVIDINPSSFIWQELILFCNSPVIKKELFVINHLYEECEVEKSWETILHEKTKYPVGLIKSFLIQHFFYKIWKSESPDLQITLDLNPMANDSRPLDMLSEFNLLRSLAILFPYSKTNSTSTERKTLSVPPEFIESKIPFLSLHLQEKDHAGADYLLLYVDASVINLTVTQVTKLKDVFKEVFNSIIIVPDESIKHIVCSLFALKPEGILTEKELLTPHSSFKLFTRIKQLYEGSLMGRFQLGFYQRPSIAQVLEDALNNENKTRFLKQDAPENQISQPVTSALPVSEAEVEYANFLLARDKYMNIYENTPAWYKKIGQIIKILKGNKRIVVKLADKGSKNYYMPTAEDVTHWYYLQYEVLPGWYKNVGRRLIKPKEKE